MAKLEQWVLHAEWPRDEHGALVNKPISEDLVRYVADNFDTSPEVRALLAIHLLKCDSLSLDIGDVTSPGDRILAPLYRYEFQSDYCGRTDLRTRIDEGKYDRYHLDTFYNGVGQALLDDNRLKFQRLSTTWVPAGTAGADRPSTACAYDLVFKSQTQYNHDIVGYSLTDGTLVNLTDHPADDTHPAWGGNDQITFISNRTGTYEIYVMDADGGNLKRLTRNVGDVGGPMFIPGQMRISFGSRKDGRAGLYVMDIDGRNISELPRCSGEMLADAWDPSGKRLAVVSRRFEECRLLVGNADDGDYSPVTDSMDWIQDPMWSSDGGKIVFNGEVGARTSGVTDSGIYVVYVESKKVKRLTDPVYHALKPCWSPCGRKVFFCARTDRYAPTRIYVMDCEGETLTMLNVPEHSLNPVVSPDGRKLAFEVWTYGDSSENWDIWVLDMDSGHLTRVTSSPAWDEFAFWVPQRELENKVHPPLRSDGNAL